MRKKTKKKWMQKAVKRPGSFRRLLIRKKVIKPGQKIPASVKEKLAKAKIGTKVKVDGVVKVTKSIKRKAVLARTFEKYGGKKTKKRE